MHDEQMTEEKKKIIHLLLSHMTGRFILWPARALQFLT